MKTTTPYKSKKHLNNLNSIKLNMKKRLTIKQAQKDPNFTRDIKKFIKITTGIYKLKDYGLEKIGLE